MIFNGIIVGGIIGILYSFLKYKYESHRTEEQFKRIHYCGDFLTECMGCQELGVSQYPFILYQIFNNANRNSFTYEIHYFNERCLSFEDREIWKTVFKNDISYETITNTFLEFLLINSFDKILINVKDFKCIQEKDIDLTYLPCYNRLLTRLSMRELTT